MAPKEHRSGGRGGTVSACVCRFGLSQLYTPRIVTSIFHGMRANRSSNNLHQIYRLCFWLHEPVSVTEVDHTVHYRYHLKQSV